VFWGNKETLRRFAEQALQELLSCRSESSRLAAEGARLQKEVRHLEETCDWYDKELSNLKDCCSQWRLSHETLEEKLGVVEKNLENNVNAHHIELTARNFRLQDASLKNFHLSVQLAQLTEKLMANKQVEKQDQTTQTNVETSPVAVELQASVEVCESGCQTFSRHGNQHECCEKAVQTAFSCTILASVICWKCGKHGHYRSQCWSKGRRKCFHCKKVGHIRRFCPSRAKVELNTSPSSPEPVATPVLAVSKAGGLEGWGQSVVAHAPNPPDRA
jgi:Tfp pilus assembly protein PilV